MQEILHTIENNGLYGLADDYDREIVECVYDQIKVLESGKYIVIKDKMAGILDSDGTILLYPQSRRIHYIKGIDLFKYKVGDQQTYFTFINNTIYYIDVDKLKFDEKMQIINACKDGKWKVYNANFIQISTGYEQIEPTEFKQGNSRFYLGLKNGMWGVFKIKKLRKYKYEIIAKFDNMYSNPEEALLAFKISRKSNKLNHGTCNKHK